MAKVLMFERQFVEAEMLRQEMVEALGVDFISLAIAADLMRNAVIHVEVTDRTVVEDVQAVVLAHDGTKNAVEQLQESSWASFDATAKDDILKELWVRYLGGL